MSKTFQKSKVSFKLNNVELFEDSWKLAAVHFHQIRKKGKIHLKFLKLLIKHLFDRKIFIVVLGKTSSTEAKENNFSICY